MPTITTVPPSACGRIGFEFSSEKAAKLKEKLILPHVQPSLLPHSVKATTRGTDLTSHSRAAKSRGIFLVLLCAATACLFLACNAKSQQKPAEDLSIRPSLPVGKLTPGRDMSVARGGHTASFLPDFTVLIVGGKDEHGTILASAEVYDPTTAKFTPAASMARPREGHIAGVLSDSKILVAGGVTRGGATLSSSEDFDFETGKFTTRGTLHTPRAYASSVVLRDGRILAVGGSDGKQALESAEGYDVLDGKWTLTGKMSAARMHHTATVLSDGRVLITGGTGASHAALATAEIFDPQTNKFSPVASMLHARSGHTAALLANGSVLIAGGTSGKGDEPAANEPMNSAEIYDPKTNTFTATGSMAEPHFNLAASSALLDGRVLIVGGGASAEIFDPRSRTFRTVEGSLETPRYWPAIVQLMDGSTRIFGGYDSHGASTAKTWSYQTK